MKTTILLLFLVLAGFLKAQTKSVTPFTVVQFYKNKKQVFKKQEYVKFEIITNADTFKAFINNYNVLHPTAAGYKNDAKAKLIVSIKKRRYIFNDFPVRALNPDSSQLLCVYLDKRKQRINTVQLIDNYYTIDTKVNAE